MTDALSQANKDMQEKDRKRDKFKLISNTMIEISLNEYSRLIEDRKKLNSRKLNKCDDSSCKLNDKCGRCTSENIELKVMGVPYEFIGTVCQTGEIS